MTTETKRGFRRILANYGRLFLWLILGIIQVPLLVAWLGLDAFGLISLVGVSVGLASVLRDLIDQSMIREIGAAYHTHDRDTFLRFYNSAFVVSCAAASITAVVLTLILIIVPWLNIPHEWVGAARWVIGAQGGYIVLLMVLSPAMSMYRVKEQFVWDAFWNVLMRATNLTSVLVLAYGVGIQDVATGIRAHGLLWSSLLAAVLLLAVAGAVAFDRRLVPRPGRIRADAVRRIVHTVSWSSAANIGMNLHRIFAAFLMNFAFGVYGNAVFEVAHRLIAYVRMCATGISHGIEATSVRLSTAATAGAVRALIRHSARLQSLVALSAGLVVFVLAEPLLDLWIGRRLENPEVAIPAAVVIVRILMVAILVRSVTDAWTLVLYGAGYVRRYAPLVLAGGLVSPVVGGLLLLLLPAGSSFYAPAIGYSAVVLIVHLLLLPAIGSRCLGIPYVEMFTPLLRPLLVTILCSPLIIAPAMALTRWTLPSLLVFSAAFGLVYAVASWRIVLTPEERKRFGGAARRRLAALVP